MSIALVKKSLLNEFAKDAYSSFVEESAAASNLRNSATIRLCSGEGTGLSINARNWTIIVSGFVAAILSNNWSWQLALLVWLIFLCVTCATKPASQLSQKYMCIFRLSLHQLKDFAAKT